MSRKFVVIVAVLSMLGGYSVFALDQVFNVLVDIRQPVGITPVSNLDFGIVELPGVATPFTVLAASTGHTAGLNATAAEFTITGESGATAGFSVVSPVTISDGTTNLSVTLTLSSATVVLAGTDTFYVGGVVTIDNNATTGTPYSGSSTLTVLYQ